MVEALCSIIWRKSLSTSHWRVIISINWSTDCNIVIKTECAIEILGKYFSYLLGEISQIFSNFKRLENLLLNNYAVLKISDFGHARIFQKGWDFFNSQLVGSLYHLAPEQIKGNVYSGEKLDIWSLGIILFCFVTAQLPFCSADVQVSQISILFMKNFHIF